MTAWDALAARRAGVPVFAPGHVWLAGAGPGDPGLLTLDALAGLAQADVVVHDALVDRRVLALAGPQARLEFAGKRGGKPSATQADISKRLVALARAGKRVLRLKGGDPFVFGRGGEEAMALAAAGVPFRVIPGVTAGLAALAAAAIPATLRGVNRAVIFAAGHGADEDFDWAPLARTGQPIVLYMAMHNLERIAGALMRGGLAPQTPAAVIASATTPKQRVLISTLEKLAADAREQKFEPPAIVVIGDIVAMREQLLGEAWRLKRIRRDGARPHHRGAAFRRRQDHRDAGAAGGAQAARHRGARGQGRARLYRSGLPCRRDRRAERQSRQLGDAAGAARRADRAMPPRRRDSGDRRRHGPVRRRAGTARAFRRHRRSRRAFRLAGAAGARRVAAGAIGGGRRAGICGARSGGAHRRRRAQPRRQRAPSRACRRRDRRSSAFKSSAPCRAKRRWRCPSAISAWSRPASTPI